MSKKRVESASVSSPDEVVTIPDELPILPLRDTVLKMRFALPGSKRQLEAEGVVCWSVQKAGMGMRFTKVKQTDEAVINGFVEAHFFRTPKKE